MFRQFTTTTTPSIRRFKIRCTAVHVYAPYRSRLVPKSGILFIVNENTAVTDCTE